MGLGRWWMRRTRSSGLRRIRTRSGCAKKRSIGSRSSTGKWFGVLRGRISDGSKAQARRPAILGSGVRYEGEHVVEQADLFELVPQRRIFTVSQIAGEIRSILAGEFGDVWVSG